MRLFVFIGLTFVLLVGSRSPLVAQDLRFNRDIRPILSENCFRCHGPDAEKSGGGLRLDTEAGVKSAFGGQLRKSEGWKRINSNDPDLRMPPPKAKLELKPQQLEVVGRWLDRGAKWEGHWAFIAPRRPPVPAIADKPQLTPIDAFVEVRLRKEKVLPVSQADPATLLRRLSLDVIGLPPTPQQLSRFLNDRSPRAWERQVDRLLASPQFGERLAVYWLDLVRYADSVGYHKDSHRDCWLYRDYVVESFNDNVPYNTFVVEQLAGDLLKGNKFQQYRWKVASGFNRMNQTTSEGGAQPGEYLAKYSADRVRNTAAIFLGTTMGCSECHDHKYDPFTAHDFYSFAAYFADLKERGVGYPGQIPMPSNSQLSRWRQLESELSKQRLALKGLAADKAKTKLAVEARIKKLEAELKLLTDSKKWGKTLVTVSGKPRPIRLLPRGNWLDSSGPIMTPAVPRFLGQWQPPTKSDKPRQTRLDLARWIADRKNPLTARVFVNRLWKLFYGEGISRTLDDLGSQGEWPTHPELLDWLAVEFMESGWDIKHMVKLMVTTKVYQRRSDGPAALFQLDPENQLLARQARYRLSAEFVRDNALAISGLLSPKMFGPSVKPYQPANYWYRLYKDAKYNTSRGEDQYRRGLYTYWRRSFWHASLRAFDAPAREECVARRPRSNTPQQSLVLLNDPTYVEAARALATRMMNEEHAPRARIDYAFIRALSRPADDVEAKLLERLFYQQRARYRKDLRGAESLLAIGDLKSPAQLDKAELAAWTTVARTILNLHETITRN